jgi:hypothetical protein
MSSVVDSQHLKSRLFIRSYDHDPNTTGAETINNGDNVAKSFDLKGYSHFAFNYRSTIAAGNVTRAEIVASAVATMTNPVVVKDSGTIALSGSDNNVTLDMDVEELNALGDGLRYVAGRVTHTNSSDEGSGTYIAKARDRRKDLTPLISS